MSEPDRSKKTQYSEPELSEGLKIALRNWMPEVIELTRDVGQSILEIYRSSFQVNNKKDNTPVTCAAVSYTHLTLPTISIV